MRDDEKKEDYREEPICGRRGNGAYQKTANYLCDGKILCIDFARKFGMKTPQGKQSDGMVRVLLSVINKWDCMLLTRCGW